MHTFWKKHFVLEKPFLRSVLAIAVPIALQNCISFGVQLTDSIMLGKLGDVAVSAASVGAQPFNIMMSFIFGLTSGASVLMAQYWGKKDISAIADVMRLCLQFVCGVSVVITLLALALPRQIASLYSDDAAVVSAAAEYIRMAAFSYLPYALSGGYMMCLRAVEQVNMSAKIYGASFFVNVFFNYVFIFGKFGFPQLGVRGAAVGTVLARVTELLLCLVYMYRSEKTVRLRVRDFFRWNTNQLSGFVRHCLPVVGNELLWGVGFSLITVVIGRISTEFVTANSISGMLNQLTFITLIGVANAAGVLTGKTIGAGDKPRAVRVANTMILFSFLAGTVNCAVMLLLRPVFLSWYDISAASYALAWDLITVLAVMQFSMGIELTVIVGIMRGGGDTRMALLFDCCGLWLVALPLGMLTGWVLHWPMVAVYVCLRLDSPIKLILSLIRVRSKQWIRDVTHPSAPPLSSAEK